MRVPAISTISTITTAALVALLPAEMASSGTGAQAPVFFREMRAESGIDFPNTSGEPEKRYIVSSLGSGAALFDYDEDGDLDLYLVNGAGLEGRRPRPAAPNRLYRNDGGFRFTDVTESAGVGDDGWGVGCSVGDFDNDGFADIYVTNIGANRLYHNRGDGTFREWSATAGVAQEGFGTSSLFFDADADGDLDLYVANYSESKVEALPLPGSRPSCQWFGLAVFCGPSGLKGEPDVFYRNEGGRFIDATESVGLHDPTGAYGLGVVAGDVDSDGDVDLYVANDSVPNFLYLNDGKGRFEDAALFAGVAYNLDGLAQAGMGVDMADLDGNGRLDIFVTNFSHDTNTAYLNAGDGVFADETTKANLRMSSWFYLGWATRFVDFDNDGDHDIFVANGHVYPQADGSEVKTRYRQRNQIFWNDGSGRYQERDLAPEDATQAEASSRGGAFGDIDNDGDIDAVIVNIDDQPSILKNEGASGHSLTLRLVGRASNRSAIGARVTAVTPQGERLREVRPSGSFLSSSDPRLHFGAGPILRIEELRVRWPSGREQRLTVTDLDFEEGAGLGSFLTLTEPRD